MIEVLDRSGVEADAGVRGQWVRNGSLCVASSPTRSERPMIKSYVELPGFAIQVAAFVGILQICFYYCDLYDFGVLRRKPEQLLAIGQSIGAGCLLLGILYFIFPYLLIGRGVFFIGIVLVIGVVLLRAAP